MDLINDILERLAKMLPAETLTETISRDLEQAIRAYYGGDRLYIAKNGDDLSERNEAIRSDWLNGERIPLIARRYKISRVHVWRILHIKKSVTSLP